MKAVGLIERRFPALTPIWAMPATRQLIRYAFAGFCITQLAACIYSALVFFLQLDPLAANVLSTGCGLSAGYVVHSRWSFATAATNEGWQVGRFLLASFFAFVINSMWVWFLVKNLRLPPLTPVPFMMFATPWISFLLNRHWVFKAA
jgi:putative flippase GtrA